MQEVLIFAFFCRLATQEAKDLYESYQENDSVSNSVHVRDILNAKNIKISDLLLLHNDSFITLPPQIRCASHTINLVCAKDFFNSLRNAEYATLRYNYEKVEKKCSQIWKYQNQSSTKADFIKNKLGKYLTTPAITRWNSLYDSFCDILEISKTKKNALNVICDNMKIEKFSDDEITFLQHFCDVSYFVFHATVEPAYKKLHCVTKKVSYKRVFF